MVYEDDALTTLVERVSKPLNRLLPPSKEEVTKLRAMLMSAGYLSNRAVSMFRGIQIAAMLGLPAVAFIICLLLNISGTWPLVAVGLAFCAGFL